MCATFGEYKNNVIITLLETHKTHKNSDEIINFFSIPGYTFSFKCRVNGPGGVVAMYVSNDITWKRPNDYQESKRTLLSVGHTGNQTTDEPTGCISEQMSKVKKRGRLERI